jgi:hypothetical protein
VISLVGLSWGKVVVKIESDRDSPSYQDARNQFRTYVDFKVDEMLGEIRSTRAGHNVELPRATAADLPPDYEIAEHDLAKANGLR